MESMEKKKRKRTNPFEDEDVAVKVQKSDTDIAEINAVEVATEDEPCEEDAMEKEIQKRQAKKGTNFDMRGFRKKLHGNEFVPDLQHLLYLHDNGRRDMAQKFLEKKGNALEVTEAFKRLNVENISHVSSLTRFLQLVLNRIVADYPTATDGTTAAARYFVKTHSVLLQNLLKSRSPYHREVAIEAITVLSTMVPDMIRTLLNCFNYFQSKDQLMECFGPKRRQTRALYMKMITTLLVEGSTSVIRILLDKYELINVALSALEYDPSEMVISTLTALRKCILESLLISKTKKVHVFDYENIRSLFNVYQWKGPTNFRSKERKTVNPETQDSINECLTDFLILLLSNRKYGIAFDAMTHFKEKKNDVQKKILPTLKEPWKHTKLIVEILKACPELAEGMIKHLCHSLRKATEISDLFKLVADIVDSLPPKVMRSALKQINLTQFTRWIKSLCLPLDLLDFMRTRHYVKSPDNPERRVLVARVLSVLFRQYCNYMTAIIEREKFKGNDLRKFRFEMLDHLFMHFPSVQDILLSLLASIAEEHPFIVDHMDHTFDLLINICKANRSFVDKTATVVDYLNLLYPLFEAREEMNSVKLKGMKLLLMLNPRSLLPEIKSYYSVLEHLCSLFMDDRGNNFNVGPLLQKLLLNSNLFDNGILEIDIWLQAMKFMDVSAQSDIGKCWNAIQNAKDLDMSPYKSIDYSSRNLQDLFHNIEKGVSVQGFMDIPVMSKALVLMLQHVEQYPAAKEYFELVAFLLFHFIPAPLAVEGLYNIHYSTYSKYMITWLHKQKPGKLKSDHILPGLAQLNSAILEGRWDFSDTFKGDELIILDGKEVALNGILKQERYVMILIYQICFVVSQLAGKKHLEEIQSTAAQNYLSNLLHILSVSVSVAAGDEIAALEVSPNDEIATAYIDQALSYIYCRHLPLLQSFNIFSAEVSDLNFVTFICGLTETCNAIKTENLESYTANYRGKIVNQIIAAISETLQSNEVPASDVALKAVETLKLSEENCLRLLENLVKLETTHLIKNESSRSIYFDILVYTLNRLSVLKKIVTGEQIVPRISQFYIQLITVLKTDIILERLEESLYNYLMISHSCIGLISSDVFLAIFENTRLTKSTVKFASLLLERRKDFVEEFLKILPKYMSKKELVYPLLNVALFSGVDLDQTLVENVYKEYKNGILKAMEKPQKAAVIYKENVEFSIYLIEKCMPNSDFYKKNLRTDSVEVFHLQMTEAIFRKEMQFYADDVTTQSSIFVGFLNNFLQHFLVIVKRDLVDPAKVASICYSIYNWIKSYETLNLEVDFSIITETQTWQSFSKNCLKFGMRPLEENGQPIAGSSDETNGQFLKLFSYLFDKFYADNSEHPHAALAFEMITSHSHFFDIALSSSQSLVKTHLMQLMVTLAQKNHSVMNEKHIPILLGAYHAKLSLCDRYILALLQLYEQCGISCMKCKPFVWGEHAIEQYSLRSQDDEKNVHQQDHSIAQLMSIVDYQTCESTVENYPVWRKLNALSQLPTVEFENPNLAWRGYGRTDLERIVESGRKSFDLSILKLYPVTQKTYDNIYDPAFIMPMMVMALAPGVYLHPIKPVQNGLLGIAFSALSSFDMDMRLAAGLVHIRYREHFESNRFLDKPLWLQAYDNIQTGLNNLQAHWSKHKKTGIPRAPYVSALFLSVAMTTLIDPLNPMYKVLSMYLRVKENYNFLCVPEFNVLFQSAETDHLTHRQFILNIIRNGIKCNSDLFLLYTRRTFKALMGFYNTTMTTLDINLRILSVINICVKIPASIKLMIDHIGILPWLSTVIDAVDYFHFDTLEAIVSIISNLWYALRAIEKSPSQLKFVELRIYHLLVQLEPLISNRLSLNTFTKFINILSKTANDKHRLISEQSLDHIIGCSQRHFPDHLWYVRNVKEFGTKCVESSDSYCRSLKEANLDDMEIFALLSLRNFVVRWKELES